MLSNRRSHVKTILCVVLVLASCTMWVKPSPDLGTKARLDLRVGLLIPKAEARRGAHTGAETFTTGYALKLGAISTLLQMFTHVGVFETREQVAAAPDLVLLFEPRVASFHCDPYARATVVLGCKVNDSRGSVILDSTWYGGSSNDEFRQQMIDEARAREEAEQDPLKWWGGHGPTVKSWYGSGTVAPPTSVPMCSPAEFADAIRRTTMVDEIRANVKASERSSSEAFEAAFKEMARSIAGSLFIPAGKE